MAELRPYQQNLKNEVYSYLREGKKSVMMQLPTGGGKSVIMSSIVVDAMKKGRKVLMLVHRKELVEQLHKHMYQHGVFAGIIMADQPYRPSADVQIASVQTITRRTERITAKYDLIMTDEAHHAKADSYRAIYQWQDHARHIGVTATPVRTNGQGFSDLFEEMALGPSVKDLIATGFLVQPRVFSSPLRMDLGLLRTTAGDYNERDLYDVMNKRQITANVVDTWRKHALGKRTCVFAVNVEHSKQICSAYLEAGVRAAHVSAEMKKDDRERILRAFSKGDITVITNCDIISEGFDVPAIECVQLVRPTKSLVKYLQCCGRALRPIDGKAQAIILDHGDCVFRLGFPDDDRIWTLDGIKPRAITSEIMYRDSSGRTYTPTELPEEVNDVELVEIDRSDYRRRLMTALIDQAKPTGQLNWAWREFIKNVSVPTREEIFEFHKHTPFKHGWTHVQMLQFGYRKKLPTKPIVEKEVAA